MRKENETVNILQKSLDASWIRNRVISQNIANVDTPNYKAYEVEFEGMLRNAIKAKDPGIRATHHRHFTAGGVNIKTVNPRIVRDRNTSTRMDGNNVDIDIQNANLASNTIMYLTLVDQISAKLSRLKTVINEGRR